MSDWDPTNPRGLTLGTMSARDYSAWLDAGSPPLVSGPASRHPAVDAIGQALAHERQGMRAHVAEAVERVVEVIGDETGANERKLRERYDAELNELRVELATMTAELKRVRGEVEHLQQAHGRALDAPLPSRPGVRRHAH